MEPHVRAELNEIWAILRDVAARQDRAEKRMAKYDQRFEAARKLVLGGIKFVTRRDERRDAQLAALAQTVDKLAKTQQAFLDSLGKGGNGNGRRRD